MQPQQIWVVPQRPTSGTAVASMVLGIVGVLGGWCLIGIPCILAVIFGHLGMNECETQNKSGKGMAITGLVLGYLFVGPTVVCFILGVMGSVFQ